MLLRMHRLPNLRDERGQSLIIIAGTFVALLALVGLVTDVAIIYVNNGHLRQAVDSAAVAAVNQYRERREIDEIYASAAEFLQLQLPAGLYNAEVYWCDLDAGHQGYTRSNYLGESTGEVYTPHDAGLCSGPDESPRKRVRVEAWLDVDLVFLPMLGFDQVRLFAQAESEAAVVNMVLLLDTSESMAYDTCPSSSAAYPITVPDHGTYNSFFDCLEACSLYNPGTETHADGEGWCEPFESVRDAAVRFMDHMREGVDQAAVYHFDKTPVLTPTVSVGCDLLGQQPGVDCDPCLVTNPTTTLPIPISSGMVVPLTTTQQAITTALSSNSTLHVYVSPPVPAPCDHLGHTRGYKWQSTNVGGGLHEATTELVRNGERDIAVWVIVLLGDGAANAADWATTGWWACPPAPYPPPDGTRYVTPRCRDKELDDPASEDLDPTQPLTTTASRHCPSSADCDRPWYTGPFVPQEYDADDYARDMADLASSYQIALYTIGFGDAVIWYGCETPEDIGTCTKGRPDAGERLLRYVADVGDDGDVHTAPCGSDFYWDPEHMWPIPDRGDDCGNYYYAPDANELDRVFEKIASRVFARITR